MLRRHKIGWLPVRRNSSAAAAAEGDLLEEVKLDVLSDEELHFENVPLSAIQEANKETHGVSLRSKVAAFGNEFVNAGLRAAGVVSTLQLVLVLLHVTLTGILSIALPLAGIVVGTGVFFGIAYSDSIGKEKKLLKQIAEAESHERELLEESHTLSEHLNKKYEHNYKHIKTIDLKKTPKAPAYFEFVKNFIETGLSALSTSTAIACLVTGLSVSALLGPAGVGALAGILVVSFVVAVGFGIAAAYKKHQLDKKESYLTALRQSNTDFARDSLVELRKQKHINSRLVNELEQKQAPLELANRSLHAELARNTGNTRHHVHEDQTRSAPTSPSSSRRPSFFPPAPAPKSSAAAADEEKDDSKPRRRREF